MREGGEVLGVAGEEGDGEVSVGWGSEDAGYAGAGGGAGADEDGEAGGRHYGLWYGLSMYSAGLDGNGFTQSVIAGRWGAAAAAKSIAISRVDPYHRTNR